MKKGTGRTILIVVIILIVLIIIGYQLGWFGNKRLFSNGGRVVGAPSSGFTPGSSPNTGTGGGSGSSTVVVGSATPSTAVIGGIGVSETLYDVNGNVVLGNAKAKKCLHLTPYTDKNGVQQYYNGIKLYVCDLWQE